VLARLLHRRLAARYPALCLLLLIGCAQSEALLFVALRHRCRIDTSLYREMLDGTSPIIAALVCAVTVEIFVTFGRHLEKFRSFGSLVFAGTVAIATALGWALGRTPGGCGPDVAGCAGLIFRQTYLGTCGAVLLIARGFFNDFDGRRYKPNAHRYLRGVALVIGGQVFSNAIARYSVGDYWAMAFSQFALYLLPAVGYWQLAGLDAAGEVVTPPPPVDPARLAQAEREVERAFRAFGG
jgi:hypothetical protein